VRDLPGFQRDLLAWFERARRDLPWRETRDPYRILLSEVLLQQTQVSRGLEYYTRFLESFPTVQDLANAPVEAVLKAWEGAGYYARARNLHRAALEIARDGFPTTLTGWLELPGVGRYTAGAVTSIAFDWQVPVVDGNVRRVLARILLEPNPTDEWLWQEADRLLEASRPGDWNQAVMELGATVCTPKSPSCSSCPVSSHCAALEAGRVSGTPAPKARVVVKEIRAVALAAGTGGRYILEQRPKKGLLGGLHGFPVEGSDPPAPSRGVRTVIPVRRDERRLREARQQSERGGEKRDRDALSRLLERFGLEARGRWAGTVSHTMTHRQLEIRVYTLEHDGDGLENPDDVALSRLDKKILEVLEMGPLFEV
jgi:A/G-specific adenine glycosylase